MSLIAAIDFGTTYTGFAYGRGSCLEDIRLNKPWGYNMGLEMTKTHTSVLINRNEEAEEFGIDAEYKYSQLCFHGYAKDVELYKHFKMLLYNSKVGEYISICNFYI